MKMIWAPLAIERAYAEARDIAADQPMRLSTGSKDFSNARIDLNTLRIRAVLSRRSDYLSTNVALQPAQLPARRVPARPARRSGFFVALEGNRG